MTRRPLATSRDDGTAGPRRNLVAASPGSQTRDQDKHASRDGRDGRDEQITRLTPARQSPRSAGQNGRGNREARKSRAATSRLLTVAEAADRLGTSERFPRRLIAERRITFVKLGSHVRIPESALDDLIAASTVKAVE
jgi:excisionase family DNA binding protein